MRGLKGGDERNRGSICGGEKLGSRGSFLSGKMCDVKAKEQDGNRSYHHRETGVPGLYRVDRLSRDRTENTFISLHEPLCLTSGLFLRFARWS